MVRKDKRDDGKIEALICLLRTAAAAHPDLAEEIGAEINYFETNKERMRYPEFRDQRNQSVSVFVSAVYIARLGPLGCNHQRPSPASKAKQLLEDPRIEPCCESWTSSPRYIDRRVGNDTGSAAIS
jgi:hypothetical protein